MSTKYIVYVRYVDRTYWDDGSRWTHQTFKFDNQKDAIAFAREATTKGCEVKGQTRELHVRPNKSDVTVERKSTTIVKWDTES